MKKQKKIPALSINTRYSSIFQLALPAMVSGVIEPVISLIDTAFVGKIGTQAIASVGVGSSLFLLFVWIIGQGKSALSAIVSQHVGRSNLQRILPFVFLAICSLFILSALIAGLSYQTAPFLLGLYGITGDLLVSSTEYFQIRVVGLPFTIYCILSFGFFRGIQNTRIAMYTSLIGGLVNVLLDYYLIVHHNYGVNGAAFASFLSQLAMALYISFQLRKYLLVHFKVSTYVRSQLAEFFRITIQLFLRTAVLNAVYFYSNRKAALAGEAGLAAHTIGMNIWLFSSFLLDGYANASNAIGGALYGAKNGLALIQLRNKIVVLGSGTGLVLGGLYYFGFPIWSDWFTQADDVLASLLIILPFLAGIQVINGLAFGLDGFFKGFGHAKFLKNVLILSTLFLFLPPMFLEPIPGITTVWLSLNLWMLGRFLLPLWKFNSVIRSL